VQLAIENFAGTSMVGRRHEFYTKYTARNEHCTSM
jgi:hypothetical protein